MNVRLNLATKPLESQRKFYVSAGLVAFLGGVLFLVLGWHVYSGLRAQDNLRRKEQDNDRVASQLTSRRKELDDFFARQENAKLKDRVAFLNNFIDESSFDWTRMFMDLEKTLPVGVHVLSIQPKLEKGNMSVHLTVGAVSDEAKIKFIRAMENSRAFNNVTLMNVHAPSGAQGNTDQAVMELTAIYSRT
jgi:Tfp pilus assembly protein PilN